MDCTTQGACSQCHKAVEQFFLFITRLDLSSIYRLVRFTSKIILFFRIPINVEKVPKQISFGFQHRKSFSVTRGLPPAIMRKVQ